MRAVSFRTTSGSTFGMCSSLQSLLRECVTVSSEALVARRMSRRVVAPMQASQEIVEPRDGCCVKEELNNTYVTQGSAMRYLGLRYILVCAVVTACNGDGKQREQE